jgi:hypothetical protein
MKDMLSQGGGASRDFMERAGDTARDLGKKGLAASKDLAAKANAKVQELGSKGVLRIEIKKLEGKAERLLGALGADVYRLLVEEGAASVDANVPVIKAGLSDVTLIREQIESREAQIKALSGRS